MGPLMFSDTQEQKHNQKHSDPKSKTKTQSIKKVPIHQKTLFLLDWDDTLLCTSFISKKKFNLSKEELKLIEQLGKFVFEFLLECIKKGTVIIMTNSNESWVKSTAIELMKMDPNLLDKIYIISARDIYEKQKISKRQWKKFAFEEIIKNYDNTIKNLICASDMSEDIEIFKNFSEKYNEINVSTVKFKVNPSPDIMIKEIKIMKENLDKLVGSNKKYFLYKEKDEEGMFSLKNLLEMLRL